MISFFIHLKFTIRKYKFMPFDMFGPIQTRSFFSDESMSKRHKAYSQKKKSVKRRSPLKLTSSISPTVKLNKFVPNMFVHVRISPEKK